MTHDIFVRTYAKDYSWLSYALRSIHKYVTGYRNIIVVSPEITGLAHLTAEKVFKCDDLPDGYLGQQLTKLEAWKYTDADLITFWDSDVVALEPLHVVELLDDANSYRGTKDFSNQVTAPEFSEGEHSRLVPVIWKTPYAKLDDNARVWQRVTEKWLGFKPEYEYMRRMPLTYWSSTVKAVWEYLGGAGTVTEPSLADRLRIAPYREFSEFNVLGAWAEKNEWDRYVFKDTEVTPPPVNKVKQWWSWHGINNPLPSGKTPAQELEELLK